MAVPRNLNGWVRQPHDPRDVMYAAPRRLLATLPDYFDLSAGMGPQLDQKSLGACGPFSAAECITFNQKAQGLPVVGASELFTYYCTRNLMGTLDQDSGVDNRSLMKALAGYGYAAESLWPYDVSKFKVKPPQGVIDAAAKNKITSYAAVAKDLDQMKGALVGGDPFIFGFDVFAGIMSDQAAETGVVPDPRPGESPQGGHDVSVVGFTTVERPGVTPGRKWPANTFKVRNHWMNGPGDPWGDGGYGYVSFKYGTGPNASDFWIINAIPGGAVPPPAGTLPARVMTGAWVGPDGEQVSFRVEWAAGAKASAVAGSASRVR